MALLTAILIAAALCNLQAQQAPEPPGRPTISVAGEAVVNVPPDKIILRFGVETFDQQLAKGTKQNNAIMKKAFEAISAAGIAEKDVQTDHLSIGIDYEHYQKKILKGYNVRNVFAVTIADPAKV